jgi:hypothetical protein
MYYVQYFINICVRKMFRYCDGGIPYKIAVVVHAANGIAIYSFFVYIYFVLYNMVIIIIILSFSSSSLLLLLLLLFIYLLLLSFFIFFYKSQS